MSGLFVGAAAVSNDDKCLEVNDHKPIAYCDEAVQEYFFRRLRLSINQK